MKVLLINAVCGTGSTGRIVADIWKALKDQGHEAKVAYGVGHGSIVSPEDQICFNNKIGYYTHNILAKITDKTGMYSKRQTKALLKKIDEFQPDIIHLHNLHGYYINYPILFDYLAKKDIPVVWTLHDCWAYTGHCVHYSANKCYQWKNECVDCANMKEYPTCWFKGCVKQNFEIKKKVFTSVKHMIITTPSQWLANEVQKSFLSIYPIKTIYDAIDLTIFKPTETSFKEKYGLENKIMILAVANVWSERKGLGDIVKLQESIDKNKVIVVVGVSEKQKKELPKSIISIERTADLQELVQIYSAADVFVNLSVEETFGMVTAEALACGTPVVTYDQTAVPEVADADSGIVIHAGDIEGVIEAIDAALKLDSRRVMNRATLFSKNKEIDQFITLYKAMMYEDGKSHE